MSELKKLSESETSDVEEQAGETDGVQHYLDFGLVLTYVISGVCLWETGAMASEEAVKRVMILVVGIMAFRGCVFSSNFMIGWKMILPKYIGMSTEDVYTFLGPESLPLESWFEKYDERKIMIRDSLQRKIPHIIILVVEVWVFGSAMKTFGVQPGEVVCASVIYTCAMIAVQAVGIRFRHDVGMDAWIMLTCFWFGCCRIRDGTFRYSNNLTVSISSIWARLCTNMMWWFWLLPSFPKQENALLLQLVWMPLAIGDAMAEIIGGCLGKHFFEVHGVGDINRKTLEGVAAMWISSALSSYVCVLMAWSRDELVSGSPWWWCFWITISTTLATVAETWSPRGTDNCTIPFATCLTFFVAGHFVQED